MSITENFIQTFKALANESIITERLTIIKSPIPHPVYNGVLEYRGNESGLSAAITKATSLFSQNEHGFVWWVKDTEENAGEVRLLTEKNFCPVVSFTGMMLNLSKSFSTIPKAGYIDISRVTCLSQFDDLNKIFSECFEMEQTVADCFTRQLKAQWGKDFLEHFIVKLNHQTIAVISVSMFNEKIAGIYNFAVLPDYQRKGIGTVLQRYVLSQLRAKGFEKVVLQASDNAIELYERLGFAKKFVLKGFFKTT